MISVADQVCSQVLQKAHSGIWGRNHRYDTKILNRVAMMIPIEVSRYIRTQIVEQIYEELK